MSGVTSMLELVVRSNELVGETKRLNGIIACRDETIEELRAEIEGLKKTVTELCDEVEDLEMYGP